MAAAQIPGDTYRNLQIHPTFSNQTFKHILVPVWLLTYNYGARAFQLVVNGYTGRMAGEYPKSAWKIALLDPARADRADDLPLPSGLIAWPRSRHRRRGLHRVARRRRADRPRARRHGTRRSVRRLPRQHARRRAVRTRQRDRRGRCRPPLRRRPRSTTSIHLAAYAAEGLSHFIRRFNYTNNVIGSVNLINASINTGRRVLRLHLFDRRLRQRRRQPMSEDRRPNPEDPYGIAKLAVEQELRASARCSACGT